jgi:hypothetical protein
MTRLVAGAWIMTAEGWVRLPQAPQVVFQQDLYGQTGPIDFQTWIREADDYDGDPE